MIKQAFSKILSANDVGATGGHQGGILIPKSEGELLSFLPSLDPSVKNPDAWIECIDEDGVLRKFRFVYYNNKLHDPSGTRNEYRITYMTAYFRDAGAREGDVFEISRASPDAPYSIKVVPSQGSHAEPECNQQVRIKIKSAWRRIH
jgi:hypothetical protein